MVNNKIKKILVNTREQKGQDTTEWYPITIYIVNECSWSILMCETVKCSSRLVSSVNSTKQNGGESKMYGFCFVLFYCYSPLCYRLKSLIHRFIGSRSKIEKM